MPEDKDPIEWCGWFEEEPLTLSEDSKMLSGTARRPLDFGDWTLKTGQSYDALAMVVEFDFSNLDGAEPTSDDFIQAGKLGIVKLELVDSGSYAVLAAGMTALVASLAF